MRTQKWLNLILAIGLPAGAALAQPAPTGPDVPPAQSANPAAVALPPGAAEVVRLSENGTGEDVILSYIHDSTSRYNLSADQILYLRDIGCSSAVISAMLTRDRELQGQSAVYNYDQKLYPPANAGAVAPQPVPAEPPVTGPAEGTADQQPPPPPPSIQAAPPPTYVTTPPPDVTYFYDDLAPYGTWVQLDGVGWCWQPRVVVMNHAWRPYCDSGYWVYSDAGWYWQSTYSWGWAPFHYGRWHMHPRCGWVWLPDRVWGPSWVVWRSESDHCGWAPLPPHAVFEAGIGWRFNGVSVGVSFDFGLRPDHFTFVAMRDFNNHDLGHHRMPTTEVTRIYNHTTIINNYTVNNTTIVNQGIKVDRVAAATHTQIHPVAIRDVPAGSHSTTVAQSGGRTPSVIYRPQLSAPAHRTTMVAQRVDEKHPVIQHTPVPATTRTATAPANNYRPPAGSQRSAQAGYANGAPNSSSRPPAYRQENAGRSATPAPPTASAPSYSRAPNANMTRPEQGNHYSPPAHVGTEAAPGQYRSARPSSEAYNPGSYYPKGYYQSSELHSLPPQNSHPVPQQSQRPDQSGGAQPNSSNGHQHKN